MTTIRKLAKLAVKANDARNAAIAAMTPEDRAVAIAEWARRLAEDSVAAGERQP